MLIAISSCCTSGPCVQIIIVLFGFRYIYIDSYLKYLRRYIWVCAFQSCYHWLRVEINSGHVVLRRVMLLVNICLSLCN